jgi:PTH1 family peptidyl-tRNA hydrolase
VGCLVKKYDVPLNNLVVIYDDLDLPLGKVRIRQRGSAGGHKGMGSIISTLGSEDFPRIRVGIGRPASDDEDAIVSYVLGNFTPREEEVIRSAIIKVAEAINCFLAEGLEAAMNKFN